MGPPLSRLSGRAARFVQMLRDFGHLDDEGVNRLVLGAADLLGPGANGEVGLAEVRRAAAMMLFPEGPEDNGPILEADWPILFS